MENFNDSESFNLLTREERIKLLTWIIQNFKPIKKTSKKHSSYELKHYFERSKDGFYITNGAFKGAMICLGYKHTEGINWYFDAEFIGELNE